MIDHYNSPLNVNQQDPEKVLTSSKKQARHI